MRPSLFQKCITVLVLIPYFTVFASAAERTNLQISKEFVAAYTENFESQDFRTTEPRRILEEEFVQSVRNLRDKGEAMDLFHSMFQDYQANPSHRAALEELVPLVAQGRAEEIKKLNEYHFLDSYSDKFFALLALPLLVSYSRAVISAINSLRVKRLKREYREFLIEYKEKNETASAEAKADFRARLIELNANRQNAASNAARHMTCSLIFSGAAAIGAGIWSGLESYFGDHTKYDPAKMQDEVVYKLFSDWEKRAFDLDDGLIQVRKGEVAIDEMRKQNWRKEAADLTTEIESLSKRPADGQTTDLRYLISLEPLQAKLFAIRGWLSDNGLAHLQKEAANQVQPPR